MAVAFILAFAVCTGGAAGPIDTAGSHRANRSIAVIAVSPEGSDAQDAASLARGLTQQGVPIVAGAPLRELILAGARQKVVEVSPDAEASMINLEHDYDDGEFADVAHRSQDMESEFAREPPSERREALVRELELLWGAALLSARGRAAATAHFERVLTLYPLALADQSRFSPPVQELLERIRSQLAKRRRVTLTVTGPVGATLFVDGLAQGPLPRTVALLPHRATVWVNSLGRSSLVHEVDLAGTTTLAIDVPFETAVRDLGGEVALVWPMEAASRKDLIKRVAAISEAAEVVIEESAPSGTSLVTRFSAEGEPLAHLSFEPGKVKSDSDWRMVGRDLLSPAVAPTAMPNQRSIEIATGVPPAAISEPLASPSKPFPWLATGLVAGGVAIAAVVVAIVVTSSSSNAVLLGPKTGTP